MRKFITSALLALTSFAAIAATPIVTLHDATGARVNAVDYVSVAACESAAQPLAPGPYECRPSNRVVVAPAISEWIDCAPEGGTCTFTGTRQVRYGASGKYNTKTFTGSTVCSNAVFGDPIAGVAKRCAYSGKSSGGGGGEKPVEYTKTQMFALANPSITVMAGQDMTLRVRFYGVKLPDQSKVFGHLYRDGDDTIVADLMHHYQWVATQSWAGYTEYDYLINVPIGTPPGSYRLGSGLGQGVAPYAGRQDYVECNGVPRLHPSWSPTVQDCEVGRVTVTAATMPASTVTNGPMNMFYATGRAWAP